VESIPQGECPVADILSGMRYTRGPQLLLHPGKTSSPHRCTAQEPKDELA